MRTSEYYGVQVPELGDRADITVVSQAIIDSENNQSGKVENMKASLSGSIISLVSESRTDKLVKYYNGLAVQFISPVNAQAGTAYKIKIDNLAEQPYNNKTDIKVGDIVQAYYSASGFVSSNTPIPRSSSTSSSSEVTVATSLAVKNANDNANTRALKTTQIIAGNGLIGGGALSGNVTLNVVSGIAGLVVNADNISLSLKDTYEDTSTTHAPTANALKKLYDFVKGSIACPYNVGDIFLTTNATNPSTVWLGTTWQKIEGRMLLGTSGGGASKATGGSNTAKLSTANLPSHTHSASQSAHTHSRGTQNITGSISPFRSRYGGSPSSSGAFTYTQPSATMAAQGAATDSLNIAIHFTASRNWSGATSSAQPAVTVGATGSGSAFSILSSYYTVHMWLRLT